ncbi:aldo/keto reductase [Haloarcula sp. NS06]|uniref:aldo/keto reductase n=1 Tax=unclassified Haloarcula TaxID=2624677 RepID=UPI0027B3DD78|nr:aldo/keto reductase [Haloarcula sp. H-GB4]MDQ2072208.1 aldo/keto reductase [Haloarcula sp. H-GB4]
MSDSPVTYTTLGSTGLDVSELCLGTMNFGSAEPWMLNDEAESRRILERALDLGINFFDTANAYSNGESERILGEAVDSARRDELVLASKVYFDMHDGPNGSGLSKKHIIDQCHATLDRLGVDYLDLYQIHRWDEDTPIEETLDALTYLVDEGLVRYIGASTMANWKFQKALYTADIEGYERFVSMQPEYSAVDRHEEANLLPVCEMEGIGVIPWSPLAGGFLAGKYDRDDDLSEGRASTDEYTANRFSDENWAVLDEVQAIADAKDATPAQVSLAWLCHQDVVDAPIIGPRTMDHLEENVGALDVDLSDEECARIEAPKQPQWPVEGKD